MISIIVCSRGVRVSNSLRQNIADSIGEAFEIICIDNSRNRYSIFEAYHQGVLMAKGDYLLFIHDDIRFLTPLWGEILRKGLADRHVGVAGVVGGHIIDETSCSWTSSGYYSGQVVQVRNGEKTYYNHNLSGLGNSVAALDGMLLGIRKELFEQADLRWDSSSYCGFHFYDLDICMQAIQKGYRIAIVPIALEHYSCGSFDTRFFDNCAIFHRKWDSLLPVCSPSVTPAMQKHAYRKAMEKICAQGKMIDRDRKLMHRLPYLIITKILLMLGIDPYRFSEGGSKARC